MATKTALKKPRLALKSAKKAAAKAAQAKSAAVKKAAPRKPEPKPAPKASAKVQLLPKGKIALKPAAKAIAAAVAAQKKPARPEPLKKDGKILLKPGESETPGDADSPLLDMSDVGVRKMITRAKTRGYVTYDELNKVLPSDKVSSEQIEDTMSMLNEMGINVIESEEQEEGAEGPEGGVPATTNGKAVATVDSEKETYDRTDDPVRMYLREMGSVELLSREGEIAIAKRIEAGRELMIGALCESPLTFEALTVWRDELNEGKVLLRDIIDLEAMYGGGPDAQAVAAAVGPDGQPIAPPIPPQGANGLNGHTAPMPPRPPVMEMKKPEPPVAAPAPKVNGEEPRCTRSLASCRTRRLKPSSHLTIFPPARSAASRSCATIPSISSRASSSTITASRRWSTRCTASIAASSALKESCCASLKRTACCARIF